MDKRDLKAYIRYDKDGRVISGGPRMNRFKPKSGGWEEIDIYASASCKPCKPGPPFISVWRTTAPDESITLPYSSSGTYSGIIDWGDGTTSDNSYANRTHTYATAGDYTITITGSIIKWSFGIYNNLSASNIISITQWGNIKLGNDGEYFSVCNTLNLSGVTDVLDLNGTTNLNRMFNGCTLLTTVNRLNEWNVSSVTNMSYIFNFSSSFNEDISAWDVSSVTDMSFMFTNTAFNQDISNWNVSNVTNMRGMFQVTALFNQNIGNWDVSGVTNMTQIFGSAIAFNQNIGSWNVSSVIDMDYMFISATAFNNGGSSTINNWDVSNVTNMAFMFANATSFNQNIGNWDVSSVTDMSFMLGGATSFNQNIGNWNVGNVTSMSDMFRDADAFNQNISSWNVSNVIDMPYMFYSAQLFNQDLSSWCVSSIPSTPTNFSIGASAWVLPKPVWGTCPV